MDQALWNTLHGAPLHQTICNSISDTNCLGDISRLAIHFEPILYPISLLYLIAPSPKTLLFLQTLVVASGAFPAYWIASRRLASPLAGVAFAVVYLLYPALTSALTSDFHAVTLSAAFLMFALYFMLTRNNVGLFIACLLALSTKEEIPADVLMIGLSILILQRRRKVGLALMGLAVGWVALYLVVSHAASPLGHSPLASRWAYLGSGPVQIVLFILTHPLSVLRGHVLDPLGRLYLRSLLSGAGYLSLFSPLTLVMAAPVAALNILSSDPTMRSGSYQYNAELVPFLVLAAIESVALFASVAKWLAARVEPALAISPLGATAARGWNAAASRTTTLAQRLTSALTRRSTASDTDSAPHEIRQGAVSWRVLVSRVVMAALVLLALGFSLREQRTHGSLPISQMFQWPQQTPHTRIADQLAKLIPPGASVCAQANLAPHVSERRYIYQFPYNDMNSDYVFLDVTGFRYPFNGDGSDYFAAVNALLTSGRYHVVAAQDGYLLLARGAAPAMNPADPHGLPQSFYSFAELLPGQQITHPLDVRFGPSLALVGYDVTPTFQPYVGTFITVSTYWTAFQSLPSADLTPVITEHLPDGSVITYAHLVATEWHPMSTWTPGQTMVVRTDQLILQGNAAGTLRFSVSVLSGSGTAAARPLPPEPASADSALTTEADGSGMDFATVHVR